MSKFDNLTDKRCYTRAMAAPITFTFVCLADNQVATFVDLQGLEEGGQRQHALRLLSDHPSATTVEVWRDDAVWEVIDRDGVRSAVGADRVALLRPSPSSKQ